VAALARQQQWQIPLVIRFIVTIQPRWSTEYYNIE
jgi:hypothetical protein